VWSLAASIQVLNAVQGLCQSWVVRIKAVATFSSLLYSFSESFVSRSSASRAVWPSGVLPKGEMQQIATPITCNQFFHIILHLMNKLNQRFSWGGALAKYTTLLFVGLALCLVSFTASAQSSNWKSGVDAQAALKPVIVAIESSANRDLDVDPQLYANNQAKVNLCNSIYNLIRTGKTTEEAFNEATSVYSSLANPASAGVSGGNTAIKTSALGALGPDAQPHAVLASGTSVAVSIDPVPTVRSLLTD